jgi:hypothetical protein
VRNPYTRIISDLFFLRLIEKNMDSDTVYNVIEKYIVAKNTDYIKNLDNHNLPQYIYVTDENNQLYENITIMKTETLNECMVNFGFKDFKLHVNQNINKCQNYYSYLNKKSIQLINNYYDYDFKLFDYKKILV